MGITVTLHYTSPYLAMCLRRCDSVQLLHQSRVKAGPAKGPAAAAFLDSLWERKGLYTAPFGSNDDWYWIYAAVQAGRLSVFSSLLTLCLASSMHDW